ncbi:uncharacterized protein ARMOST_11527 [Armillaria ostoyae]|uniref:Retrotransposon gag domain-containing protein n=1 Tax=Armillaria ostoyae TaxID=47428 RepID=A0A284RHD5_ARMOS|nr:uncharacterized protein ARMOST_11527 [Armillaria ostoyae]
MTPDLMQQQLIGIISAIVGTCLTSLFTTLVVLTWREQILEYLYRHGILLRPRRRRQPPAPFPLHYVLPYANSESTMDRPILEEQCLQSHAPYPPNSSDEFPPRPEAQPPQRNTTPGPSNTRHTPTPPSSPAPEEVNNRDLRACYDSFPPPEYDLPPLEQALLPIRPCPLMAAPGTPAQCIFIRPPLGQFPTNESSDDSDGGFFGAVARRRNAGRLITITTDDENDLDALELPLPDDDGDDSVLHLPPPRRPDDPLNADGLDYEWPELAEVDRQILGPERSIAWDIQRNDVEVRYNLAAHNRITMDEHLAITYGDELPRLGRAAVITARIHENRDHSRHGPTAGPQLYGPHRGRTHEEQLAIEDALQNDFDHFHYNYNLYADELSAAPFPLPDSPGYHVPQYNTRTLAGQGPDDETGGSDNPPDPRTDEEREASKAAGRLLLRIAELEKELNDEEMRKEPDRGRQPAQLPLPPNQYRPLWRHDDRYLVPRPPPGKGRPDPLPQPVGSADATAPFMNVHPTMVILPKAFTGDHEDIERFIGDCLMYFEAHASYFILPSHMIPFATSLFDGAVKTWWVHERLKYWSGTGPAPQRFRYPTWEEFINDVNSQFRDPTAMEVQEKKMFDLRMGNGPATTFFQELEVLATKAGR